MSLAFASTELSSDEFRRRRDEARRNGSPAWLWPEVPVESWAEAMAAISRTASAVLANRDDELPPIEPIALSVACYTSGMGPLLGLWLEQGLIAAPDDQRGLLAMHLAHARERESKVKAQAREVVAALADCAVPVAVLKGGHTAYVYFPEPAARPASDLDLLVERDSSAQAEVALARLGLECAARSKRESSWLRPGCAREPRSIWLAHADDPWSVDLHSSLDFSASAGAPLVRFDSAEPIETSGPWPLDEAAGVLTQPLLLLHLAVHASGGLHSLTLLRIVEIVLVIREDGGNGELSWDEFLHVGALTNALGAAYPALSMAEKLTPGTIPSHVLEISAELAPRRVRPVVDKLEPATVHRIDRASVAEHFMWARGFRGWARQLISDLAPKSDFWSTYEARTWRLLRGRVSR